MLDFDADIERELGQLQAQDQYRQLRVCPQGGARFVLAGRTYLNFSANDYLGLARHPAVIAASRDALEHHGCSATASRLVCGTLPVHEDLEQALARHKGYPAALVFGSGFLANCATIPALVDRECEVFADRLAHASLIDGILLSRATLHRFAHNDVEDLRRRLQRRKGQGRALVVTESVFSMDGDLAPLAALAAAAREFDCLFMVDEAHATGVFGPGGSGLVQAQGLTGAVHVAMGTLSKALGGYGGFVAGSEALCRLIVNRGRAFIYSTGLPPAAAGAALGALQVLELEPDLGARLLVKAARFRERLQQAGLDTGASASQIVPVILGENRRALAVAARLFAVGIRAVAIRPPTVPRGTARLRFSVSLEHTSEELERAADLVIQAVAAEPGGA